MSDATRWERLATHADYLGRQGRRQLADQLRALIDESEQLVVVDAARDALVARLETDIRPLLDKDKLQGGYNCCGCSTYDAILDHAIRIVKGEES